MADKQQSHARISGPMDSFIVRLTDKQYQQLAKSCVGKDQTAIPEAVMVSVRSGVKPPPTSVDIVAPASDSMPEHLSQITYR